MFTRDPRRRGARAHGVVRRGSVLRRAFAFMLVFTLLSTCAGVGLSLKANATAHASKGTTFMIISGITSGSEMCLTAAGPQGVCMQNMLNVLKRRRELTKVFAERAKHIKTAKLMLNL